jgi:hypothetical protein
MEAYAAGNYSVDAKRTLHSARHRLTVVTTRPAPSTTAQFTDVVKPVSEISVLGVHITPAILMTLGIFSLIEWGYVLTWAFGRCMEFSLEARPAVSRFLSLVLISLLIQPKDL